MLKAKRANRVMRIPDEKAQEYQALGYEITTMDGKVLSKPDNPKEKVKELEGKLAEASEYAEARDKEVEDMKAQVAELEEKLAEAEKTSAEKDGEIADLKAKLQEAANKAPQKAEKSSGGGKQTK